MPNLNVTYADMQSAAGQLRSGEQQVEADLARLKRLIDNLVASGYVTDSSSKRFEASYPPAFSTKGPLTWLSHSRGCELGFLVVAG